MFLKKNCGTEIRFVEDEGGFRIRTLRAREQIIYSLYRDELISIPPE